MALTDLPPRLAERIAELKELGDQKIIFDALIDIADTFEEVSPSIAVRPFAEFHRVPACESEAFVWVTHDNSPEKRLMLHYAVENPQGISAKSLCALLKSSLDGCTAAEVQKVPEDLIFEIFGRTVSMGRGQGLMGIISLTKYFARTISAHPAE